MRDAVRREVLEEAGIIVSTPVLIDTVDLITPDGNGQVQYHYTLIDFVAEAEVTDLKAGGDAADARWVPFVQLDDYRLWDKTKDIITRSRALRR